MCEIEGRKVNHICTETVDFELYFTYLFNFGIIIFGLKMYIICMCIVYIQIMYKYGLTTGRYETSQSIETIS